MPAEVNQYKVTDLALDANLSIAYALTEDNHIFRCSLNLTNYANDRGTTDLAGINATVLTIAYDANPIRPTLAALQNDGTTKM